MRVFKNGWFQKFARKENISDAMLCEAVARAERGQIDADLGSGLIKQRLARPGAGKSGGFRTLVFFRTQQRAIFAFGFAKSDMANLDDADEAYLKKAAKLVLGFTDEQLDAEVVAGRMLEVRCDDQNL